MNRAGKILVVMAALWACLVAFAVASPANAAHEEMADDAAREAQHYLEDVKQEMLSLESYHMESEILLQSDEWGRFDMRSAGDFRGAPKYRYRNDWNVTYTGPFAKEPKGFRFQQYLEEAGEQLVAYIGIEGAWYSVPIAFTVPSGASADVNGAKRATKAQIEEAKRKGYDCVKHIALRKQDAGKAALDITLDMRKVAEGIAAEMKRLEAKEKARMPKKAVEKKKKEAKPEKRVLLDESALREILAQTGDFSYTLQIDDATKRVVQMDAEMTDFLRAFMGAFADFAQMPPKDRAQMEAAMQQITANFTMRMSAFNAVEPFEVPEEVRKKAKPLATPVKELREEPQAADVKAREGGA